MNTTAVEDFESIAENLKRIREENAKTAPTPQPDEVPIWAISFVPDDYDPA